MLSAYYVAIICGLVCSRAIGTVVAIEPQIVGDNVSKVGIGYWGNFQLNLSNGSELLQDQESVLIAVIRSQLVSAHGLVDGRLLGPDRIGLRIVAGIHAQSGRHAHLSLP